MSHLPQWCLNTLYFITGGIMEIFKVTEEDMKRDNLLNQVKNKEIRLKEASVILGICYRQTLRLFKKFKESGLKGIIKKYNNAGKNLKLDEFTKVKALKLRKELYYDFNILHYKEKLEEEHDIAFSYETVRQMLINENKHIPKKRKKVYRRRRRMPKAGMLVQMDSSEHLWLPEIKEKYHLIAGIDDATSNVPFAFFAPFDTTFANMHNIRKIIEAEGLFEALYVDKASHFKTTRHEGLHQNVNNEQQSTNIGMALKELGITLILANSPQAKGRIERLFRTFQDRLIKEMRLKGIKDYDEANKYLHEKFLPWYNKRFSIAAPNAYNDLPEDKNLDLIFTKRETRKVKKDNTISFYGQLIQLPKSQATLSYTKPNVEIRFNDKQELFVVYKNKIIHKTRLSKEIKESELEKFEKMMAKREILVENRM